MFKALFNIFIDIIQHFQWYHMVVHLLMLFLSLFLLMMLHKFFVPKPVATFVLSLQLKILPSVREELHSMQLL